MKEKERKEVKNWIILPRWYKVCKYCRRYFVVKEVNGKLIVLKGKRRS